MRALLFVFLVLVAAAFAPPAGARDPFGPIGRPSSGLGRATVSGSPTVRSYPRGNPTPHFTEQRKAAAGVQLQQQHRDNQYRAAAARLQRTGTQGQARAFRSRVAAIERADDLRVRLRLAEVDPSWWNSLGPNTRRVFESNGIVVRRAQRWQELHRELDELERSIEARDQPPAWSSPGVQVRR